jgi:hypothetical protein
MQWERKKESEREKKSERKRGEGTEDSHVET